MEHGAPLRLLVPVKLDLKNIQAITRITCTKDEPADCWAKRGYSRYDGIESAAEMPDSDGVSVAGMTMQMLNLSITVDVSAVSQAIRHKGFQQVDRPAACPSFRQSSRSPLRTEKRSPAILKTTRLAIHTLIKMPASTSKR